MQCPNLILEAVRFDAVRRTAQLLRNESYNGWNRTNLVLNSKVLQLGLQG